jgi:hypothetical protein
MAADFEDRSDDEKTRVATKGPPKLKPPAAAPAESGAEGASSGTAPEPSDRTQVAKAPPAIPKVQQPAPAAAEPAKPEPSDQTQFAKAPPAVPKAPPARAETPAKPEPSEQTQFAKAPPAIPRARPAEPPAPVATPAAQGEPSQKTEETRFAKGPPAIPKAQPAEAAPGDQGGAPEAGDRTQFAKAPPAMPRAPQAQPAAQPAPAEAAPPSDAAREGETRILPQRPAIAPPPAAASRPAQAPRRPAADDEAGEDEGRTVVMLGEAPAPTRVRLQRMKPAGRSEIVVLDRETYLIGRSQACDLKLYSPSASREHARLASREGKWYLRPINQKTVIANGVQVKEEVRLTHKMRLQFGGDELLFLDDAKAPDERWTGGGLLADWLNLRGAILAATLLAAALLVWLLASHR